MKSNLLKWNELLTGGINPNAGNSVEHLTSLYRKDEKPQFDETNCIHCFFCWVFCPDNAIIIENQKVTRINYDYCKGCGICANECPVKQEPKPLIMIKENIEL